MSCCVSINRMKNYKLIKKCSQTVNKIQKQFINVQKSLSGELYIIYIYKGGELELFWLCLILKGKNKKS